MLRYKRHAHTQSSPAVLGAMVLIKDTKASYWFLADVQRPIAVLHQLASGGYKEQNILQACVCVTVCLHVCVYMCVPATRVKAISQSRQVSSQRWALCVTQPQLPGRRETVTSASRNAQREIEKTGIVDYNPSRTSPKTLKSTRNDKKDPRYLIF